MPIKAGLYIISTPIGNIGDISIRAIETLQNSDCIFCEDTRITSRLLNKYDIKKKLFVYNDHSSQNDRVKIANLIEEGKVVCLVSDAGTPLISDPGYKLVEYLRGSSLHIDVIPGPCSIIAALTLSSMPTDQFYFAGFVPKTQEAAKKFFEKIKNLEATLIFFDTARSLVKNLKIAYKIYGDRNGCVVREITKLFQETKNATISQIISHYENTLPKGELVLIISGKKDEKPSISDVRNYLGILIKKQLSVKDIIKLALLEYPSYKKTQLYKEITAIKAYICN